MTNTITHLHFIDSADGLRCLMPLTMGGLGINEEINGTASVNRVAPETVDWPSFRPRERFADILRNMKAAGMVLDAGAALRVETDVPTPIHITVPSGSDAMREIIKAQDEALLHARADRQSITDAIDLIRNCGDPELANAASVGDHYLTGAIWALLQVAIPRGKQLHEELARGRYRDQRIEALEAKANAMRIQDSAAVRQLRSAGAALLALREIAASGMSDLEAIAPVDAVIGEVNAFLLSLGGAPDAQ